MNPQNPVSTNPQARREGIPNRQTPTPTLNPDLTNPSHTTPKPPFDPQARREVILAIRGSLSVSDVATDLLCQPTLVTGAWLSGGWPSHDGNASTSTSSSSCHPVDVNTQPSCAPHPKLNQADDPRIHPMPGMSLRDSLGSPVGDTSSGGVGGPTGEGGSGRSSDRASTISSGSGAVRASAPVPMEWVDDHGGEMLGGGVAPSQQQQQQQTCQHFAHGGMWLSAQAVAEDLDRRGILDALLGGGGCSTNSSRRWRSSGHPLAQQDCRLVSMHADSKQHRCMYICVSYTCVWCGQYGSHAAGLLALSC